MRTAVAVLLAALIVFLPVIGPQPLRADEVVVIISPTADATIREVSPTTNFGTGSLDVNTGDINIISSTPQVDYDQNAVWVTSRAGVGGLQPSVRKIASVDVGNDGNGDVLAAINLGLTNKDVEGAPVMSRFSTGGPADHIVYQVLTKKFSTVKTAAAASTVVIARPSREEATVTDVLAIAGTHVTQRNLTGTWRVEVLPDGEKIGESTFLLTNNAQ